MTTKFEQHCEMMDEKERQQRLRARAERIYRMLRDWLKDGKRLLTITIVFAVLLAVWMLRYETLSIRGTTVEHRNRITGSICRIEHECWI